MSAQIQKSSPGAVSKLRELMAARRLDAYVVPSSDPHMSEYTADRDNRRTYISNFTGSAGTALVTSDACLMWTDGRYYSQATKEMFDGWTLMRATDPGVPSVESWIKKNLSGKKDDTSHDAEKVVGFDPLVTSCQSVVDFSGALEGSGISVCPVEESLVDLCWGDSQPGYPTSKALVQDVTWSGREVSCKLEAVRDQMKSEGAAATVVCALDEIMWLLNIRGADIVYNPVLFAYCIVTADDCTLFIDAAKVGDDTAVHLSSCKVKVAPYEEVFSALATLGPSKDNKVWLDPARSNAALWLRSVASSSSSSSSNALNVKDLQTCFVLEPTPIHNAKGVKNAVEVAGAESAHRRDAVALCTFYGWLEAAAQRGEEAGSTLEPPIPTNGLDEVSAMEYLLKLRSEQDHFVSLSFSDICGADANGAIIHYSADKDSCAKIGSDTMLLIDCGAQYRDGTTDVTRTFHFGTPSAHQIACYTRVLQGHIALSRCVFPVGTNGTRLDSLARTPLWAAGLDYKHGTGHGVGSFLNVHEGPHGITFRQISHEMPLEPGMLVTNEPGYYEDGAFGIRIENVMVVEKVPEGDIENNAAQFLRLRAITLVPLEPKLINVAMLSAEEIDWINAYHKTIRDTIGSKIEGNALAKAWFDRCTKTIEKK